MAYKWGIVDEHRKLLYATAIIDATHFRGVWHGEQFEVRCLPDSSSVTVGDLVFCHVLPGNSELVAIFRPSARLFFWPGCETADNLAHFYEYDGTMITDRWQAPIENNWTMITWAGWFKGQIILCTTDCTDLDLVTGVKLYSINPTTWVATDLGFAATLNGGGNTTFNYLIDGAELDDKLYLVGFASNGIIALDHTRVLEYDPAAGTLVEVDVGRDAFTPSIAVWPGAIPKLIWSTGYETRESINGLAWALNYDFTGLQGSFDQGAMHTNLADTTIILAGNRNPPGPPLWEGILWESADGINWTPFLLGIAGDRKKQVSVGVDYVGGAAIPNYLYSAEWGQGLLANPPTYRRLAAGGAWGLDWAGPGIAWETPQNEALASIASKAVAMFVDPLSVINQSAVYERSLAGVWGLVQTYNVTHGLGNVIIHGAGVIRCQTNLMCQEA